MKKLEVYSEGDVQEKFTCYRCPCEKTVIFCSMPDLTGIENADDQLRMICYRVARVHSARSPFCDSLKLDLVKDVKDLSDKELNEAEFVKVTLQ